jgi:hypothetical protein
MRRLAEGLLLAAAIGFAACSVTGCGSGSPIAKLTPSRSISVPSGGAASILPSATPSILPSATPSIVPSATPSILPSVTPSILPSTSVPATPTAQPSATQSAAASAPVAQPTGSPAAASGSGSSLIWLWVVLGALVLIGVIIWVARARSRRSAVAAGWRSKIIDAYSKGAALHDAMSVAEGPGGLAAEDAGARWSDIQRRADDLTQTLYAMREAAPNEEDRARVADVLASLQAVRSGMDAERAPEGASMRQADVVRGRLRAFEAALRSLRAPDDGLPDGGMPY